jgi:hypothetical protein
MPEPETAAEKEIDNVFEGATRLRLAKLLRREALSCTPDEIIATSWEWSPEP